MAKMILFCFFACLFMFLCACTLTDNGKPGNNDNAINKPNYDSNINKEFFISAWACPQPTDEQYKLLAESGINHMIVDAMWGDWGTVRFNSVIELCLKNGIQPILNTHNRNYALLPLPEHDFYGINAFDEPNVAQMNDIASWYEAFKREFAKKTFYVNLFPIYASKSSLGVDEYQDYLDAYVEKILSKMQPEDRRIICDIYPLYENGTTYPYWLRNLEMLAKIATEYDAELYIYIQSIGFSLKRAPSEADIRYQFYVNMAYGAKGIYHFTYMTPINDPLFIDNEASIDRYGKKTAIYDYIKTVNHEVLNFDHVYLSFDWKGAMTFIGENNATGKNEAFEALQYNLKSHARLKSVSSSEDLLIGAFSDKDNYDGFIVVNYTDTTQNLSNTVNIEFNEADMALVYVKGREEVVKLNNGKLTFTLEPGEGRFVIPFKNS